MSRSSRRMESRFRPNPRDVNATKVAVARIVDEDVKRSEAMVRALRAVAAAADSTASIPSALDALNRRARGIR